MLLKNFWCLEVPSPRHWGQLQVTMTRRETPQVTREGWDPKMSCSWVVSLQGSRIMMKIMEYFFVCIFFLMCYQWVAIVLLSCCRTDIFLRLQIDIFSLFLQELLWIIMIWLGVEVAFVTSRHLLHALCTLFSRPILSRCRRYPTT